MYQIYITEDEVTTVKYWAIAKRKRHMTLTHVFVGSNPTSPVTLEMLVCRNGIRIGFKIQGSKEIEGSNPFTSSNGELAQLVRAAAL